MSIDYFPERGTWSKNWEGYDWINSVGEEHTRISKESSDNYRAQENMLRYLGNKLAQGDHKTMGLLATLQEAAEPNELEKSLIITKSELDTGIDPVNVRNRMIQLDMLVSTFVLP